MNRTAALFLALTVGCGGGGGGGVVPPPGNPFVGHYTGSWSAIGDSGDFALTVKEKTFTLDWTRSSDGKKATASGSCSTEFGPCNLQGTLTYEGSSLKQAVTGNLTKSTQVYLVTGGLDDGLNAPKKYILAFTAILTKD